jgi:hypothetical protein
MRNDADPPSYLKPSLFMVGQDSRGHWIAKDQKGSRGGLFVDRAEALRYVRAEMGHHPHAFVMVNEPIELDLANSATAPLQAERIDSAPRQQRAA